MISFILCDVYVYVDHPQRACRGVEDRLEEVEREEQEESYDIIKNMTEKYGEPAEGVASHSEQG